MIITTVVYGIRITDEFGEFIDQISAEESQLIKGYLHTKTNGFVDFPSEEEPQFFLGFETWINKTTNINNFEAIWEKLIEQAPKELKEMAYKLKDNGCDTDIHFLAAEI